MKSDGMVLYNVSRRKQHQWNVLSRWVFILKQRKTQTRWTVRNELLLSCVMRRRNLNLSWVTIEVAFVDMELKRKSEKEEERSFINTSFITFYYHRRDQTRGQPSKQIDSVRCRTTESFIIIWQNLKVYQSNQRFSLFHLLIRREFVGRVNVPPEEYHPTWFWLIFEFVVFFLTETWTMSPWLWAFSCKSGLSLPPS